jgi:tripartite-type tricarboxylate transporter receptor subunit TctC
MRSMKRSSAPSRAAVFCGSAAAAALPAFSRIASAQAYPARPVRIVSGYPPGGVNDIYARLIGQWLSERFGQSFYVENRPGAGGNIAAESVVRAAPDGHTLYIATSADAWNATLYRGLKFNFIQDFAPVATISRGPGVLVVHPSLPPKSVSELIDYAKANPGKIAVASAGVGSAPHMYWELTVVDMLHVPYRGGGPALTDLLGGQVHAYFGTMASSIEHIRTGRLRALAVTDACGGVAGHSGIRRIPAGLRREHLRRHCRAPRRSRRNHRPAERANRSRACRSPFDPADR